MEVPVLDVPTDHEEVEEARHHVDGCRGGEYDGPGLEQSGPLEVRDSHKDLHDTLAYTERIHYGWDQYMY